MPSRHPLTALTLALTLGAFGCQATTPVTTVPSEAPTAPLEQVRLLTGDAELDAADPVAQDDTVYLVPPVAGQRWVLPITYARGVEEDVQWPGTGAGTATLLNPYGQQIYRVDEGGAPIQVVIPAGQYRLIISGVDPSELGAEAQLMLDVSASGAARQVRTIRRSDEDGGFTRAMDRRPRVPCPAVVAEVAQIDLRIAVAKGELVKLSRLRAAIKPLVTWMGTLPSPVSLDEFLGLLKAYKLKDGEVPAYYYSEVSRLQALQATALFAAQRERRALIDARCP